MTPSLTNYQCPNCEGPLKLKVGTELLECEYCGTTFTTEEIDRVYNRDDIGKEPKAEAKETFNYWSQEESSHLRSYSCPSCAAELLCDDTTAATSCPYCGNPTVIPKQYSGQLKPDYVIPFKLSKEDAIKALTKHYKKKKFLPKNFSDSNHIEEIKGIYVPFWFFSTLTSGTAQFSGTKVNSIIVGKNRVITTRYYNLYRSGNISVEKVPVDGSSKMPDELMESIEPYDYKELREFSLSYLPGFMADKYDVDVNTVAPRINVRIKASMESALRNTVQGYTGISLVASNINNDKTDVSYGLLPVYLLSTRWKNKNFLFAMNGQTGKLTGDLPIDYKRFWVSFLTIAMSIMAVASLVFLLV